MHEQGDIATKFCSDQLSGSHFILQARKFLFINVTAMTLSQGHQKVIQYILPDLYFLCPKYLRFSSNGFDVTSKSPCSGGGRGRGGGNELKKIKSTQNKKRCPQYLYEKFIAFGERFLKIVRHW